MANHTASVSWTSDGQFTSGKYSRAHELSFDGGAIVGGSSSPSVVPLPFSDPAGVDPEEALVASASACHMLWFLSLAQGAGFDVAAYRDDATGAMGRGEGGKIWISRIILRPRIEFVGRQPTADELDRLHHEAHEKCFIANSLKSEIVVEPPLTD